MLGDVDALLVRRLLELHTRVRSPCLCAELDASDVIIVSTRVWFIHRCGVDASSEFDHVAIGIAEIQC